MVPKATEETDFDRTSDDESDNSSLMSDESSNVRSQTRLLLNKYLALSNHTTQQTRHLFAELLLVCFDF